MGGVSKSESQLWESLWERVLAAHLDRCGVNMDKSPSRSNLVVCLVHAKYEWRCYECNLVRKRDWKRKRRVQRLLMEGKA
jgi:hypothetical protein